MFCIEDGKAIRREVATGYGQNGMIEIVEGLTETDDVVTVGQVGLKPDATVTVINAPATSEPEAQAETAPADADDASGTVADGTD